jgi:hypothetical protein
MHRTVQSNLVNGPHQLPQLLLQQQQQQQPQQQLQLQEAMQQQLQRQSTGVHCLALQHK